MSSLECDEWSRVEVEETEKRVSDTTIISVSG